MVTKRFTHVRGGRWFNSCRRGSAWAVHPRARGAMGGGVLEARPEGGSPTCAGGDGGSVCDLLRLGRFTHVRGGRWSRAQDAPQCPSVHPRARGAMVLVWAASDLHLRFTHVRGRR